MTYEEMVNEIEKTFGVDLEDNPENLVVFFKTVLRIEKRAQKENRELIKENRQLLTELNDLRQTI